MTSEFFGPLPPSDFNRDAMQRWLDQQVVSFQKIITGSLQADNILSSSNYVPGVSGWMIDGDGNAEFNDIIIRSDFFSTNWDGTIPADLSSVDTGATAGFYLDSSAGAAQFMGDMFLGGDLTMFDSGVFASAPSGKRIEIKSTFANMIQFFGNFSLLGEIYTASDDNGLIIDGANLTLMTVPGENIFLAPGQELNPPSQGQVLLTDGAHGSVDKPGLAFSGDINTGLYLAAADTLAVAAGASTIVQFALDGSSNQQVLIRDGTGGAPSLSFISDPDTGLYRVGANRLGIAVGGNNRVRFTSSPYMEFDFAGAGNEAIRFWENAGSGRSYAIRRTANFGGFQFVGISAGGTETVSFEIYDDGQVRFLDGTAAKPGITFIDDANTGLYRGGADDIRIVTGGADRLRLTSSVISYNGNTVWHAGNDGSGSGLDADLLDGQHASAFAASGHGHSLGQVTGHTLSAHRSLGLAEGGGTIAASANGHYDEVAKLVRRATSREDRKLGVEQWDGRGGSVLDLQPIEFYITAGEFQADGSLKLTQVSDYKTIGLGVAQALSVDRRFVDMAKDNIEWNAVIAALIAEVKGLNARVAAMEQQLAA